MADTQSKLYQGVPGTSDGALVSGTAAGNTILHIHACNTTGLPATLYLAANCSATFDAAHAILYAYTLPPYGTYDLTGMIQLDANATTGTVRGYQGTASAITVIISGNALS